MDGIQTVEILFRCESEDKADELMLAVGDGCIREAAVVKVVVLEGGVINAPTAATLTRLATQHAIGMLDQLILQR